MLNLWDTTKQCLGEDEQFLKTFIRKQGSKRTKKSHFSPQEFEERAREPPTRVKRGNNKDEGANLRSENRGQGKEEKLIILSFLRVCSCSYSSYRGELGENVSEDRNEAASDGVVNLLAGVEDGRPSDWVKRSYKEHCAPPGKAGQLGEPKWDQPRDMCLSQESNACNGVQDIAAFE